MVPRWQSLQCLLFLAAVGGWAQAPQLPRAQPAAAAQSGTAGERLSGELRTTVWRGRELTYEVIDGWAVHDGDIVLGRAEEMKPAGVVAAPPGGEVPGPGLRRDAMALSRAGLWHGGVIPYEITEDATGDELRAVHLAIAEWNARTVIRLVPRTGQEAYAFFERAGGLCRSEAGSGSGRSTIYTVGCGYSVTVHEIGHSVGLGHEHQRADRDEYVMLLGPSSPSVSVRDDPFEGPWPYDYRSVMHYGDFDSIPPGMPVQQGSREGWLSAGDIDGVNRRYGEPSEATLVTTNPPGLEVVVDGYRVTTPASFHWPTGSSHVLEAPLWQAPQWRYLFGRWGDGGDRVHDFTVDPGSTWIEASFILQAPSANNFTGRRGTIYEDRFEGFDATPRALTFVANPAAGESAPQVIRLTNRGDVSQRYLVGSDRPWLVVSPAEASLAPGESADIEVRTLREGLRPDARRGELTIRPAALDAAEAAQIPGIPVAFVVLPELVPVTLGTSGETVEVAVSATEGLLGADGRPLATGGRVTAGNGDVYALTADSVDGGPTAVRARFVPRMQSLGLADGVEVVLEQRGAGDWRIGADRVRTGHRYVAGEHEYVLELAGGRWRLARHAVRTVAGRGDGAAEGIPAVDANIYAAGLVVDARGNIFIADSLYDRVRRVEPSGTITTLAGTGTRGFSGDGGPATEARLNGPRGVAVDAAGNVYVVDAGNHRLRKIDTAGTIATVAGTGEAGFSGDGGPATEARLNGPGGVAVDAAGNVYVTDRNHLVRRIDPSGTIATVAGTGEAGFSGDGGPATEARLNGPAGVAVDAAGNVYVTDRNHLVRRIDPSGTITTVAGTGEAGFSGDGGPATEAQLNGPRGVAVDAAGNVYVAESSLRLRKIDAAGTITTMRALTPSSAVAVDSAGSVYVADGRNDRLRKMDPSGAVTTVAGTGDRGPWLAPAYMTVDGAGNVYVADDKNHLVRRIDPSGTITTLAGTGTRGFSGDGSPATEARLNGPRGVAVDAAGNVYVADLGNHRLRRIDTAGTIATVAGTGEAGFSGDGGPATEARLGFPDAVAVDAAGGVYLTDWFDYRYRLRRIDPSGTIATATAAGFPYLTGVTVDSAGNAYLLLDHSGGSNGLVRKVDAAGTITTLVSFSGYPRSLATDNLGQLYVGGEAYPEGTGRIWKIDTRTGTVEVIAGPATPWFDAVDSVGAIAADSRGNVWFAADGRVRVIERLPFAPQWQDLALPGGTVVRLEHREEGSGWQIGDEPVRTGDRYAYGGSEHVIELLGGHWRVTSVSVPLGSSGESAEVAVLDDGTLSDQGRPLESGSRLTASNFDSYELTIGPGGIAATFVPRSVTTNVDHGAGLLLTQDGDGVWQLGGRPVEDGYFHVQDGWEYVLEWVQGAWQAALTGPRYSLRSVAGSTAVPEGVPAVEASLNRPAGIAVDAVGNVFVADTWNHRIRRIDIAGVIRTVVGSGDGGLSGDGGPATEAQVLAPEGVAVDAAGNVYVARHQE